MEAADRIDHIRRHFPEGGFFQDREWVLSPEAFPLPAETVGLIRALGPALARFQRVSNDLYLESAAGKEHAWVAQWLDRGKPASVVDHGRHSAWRHAVPRVIRPDLVLTEDGVCITELDSVPGGIGLTSWLNETYASFPEGVMGGAEGVLEGFRKAFPGFDMVVSEESADYRPEMRWLALRLGEGRRVLDPQEVRKDWSQDSRMYRFFELFDLDQVPDSDWLFAEVEAGRGDVSPPPKAFLEEKMWLALLWEPRLKRFWRDRLDSADLELLERCIPEGWIVGPESAPAGAELSGLGAVDWEEVKAFPGKQRELVLKVSGFSELGWGSRSVRIGHDLSQTEWAASVDHALTSAQDHPHVMQRFHRGRVVEHPAWEDPLQATRMKPSRVRLCPYYFLPEKDPEAVHLGGVLATVCPDDKKILHGMRDAMMLPCRELQP